MIHLLKLNYMSINSNMKLYLKNGNAIFVEGYLTKIYYHLDVENVIFFCVDYACLWKEN